MLISSWKRVYLCMIAMIIISLLTGCGQGSLYEEIYGMNQADILAQVAEEGSDLGSELGFPDMVYRTCIQMKKWVPLIMVGSWLSGIFISIVFKNSKEIRKWALFTLILGIPLISFVSVYLLCFLYGSFNN